MPMSLASDDARDDARDAPRDAPERAGTIVCARGCITGADMTRARVSRLVSPCPQRGVGIFTFFTRGAFTPVEDGVYNRANVSRTRGKNARLR